MNKGVKIICSNCGNSIAFLYSNAKIEEIVASGWNSDGNKLYCPECCKNQIKQNDIILSDTNTTIRTINEIAGNQ